MNPLEAMARAIYESVLPGKKWKDADPGEQEITLSQARAARNALANNVSHAMHAAQARARKVAEDRIANAPRAWAVVAAGIKLDAENDPDCLTIFQDWAEEQAQDYGGRVVPIALVVLKEGEVK